ncbi:MAG: hypothetical protein BGO98_39455 [Myxococcales bacterium 68-20]|nr:MAG: hypothetical protein BGO98_39455 [Myxococcales bacterium 68-20]
MRVIVLIGLVGLIAGCGVSAERQDAPGTDESTERSWSEANQAATGPEDSVYTETIVTTKEDGTHDVTTKPITRAQLIAEAKLEAARAAGISIQETMAHDPGCASYSNRLYDVSGSYDPSVGTWIFFGNRICFDSPIAFNTCHRSNLSLYPRGSSFVCKGQTYTRTWAGGPDVCDPVSGVSYALPDTNFVKGIRVETSTPAEIEFYTAAGSRTGGYTGSGVTHPSVSPYGRDVRTCGQRL